MVIERTIQEKIKKYLFKGKIVIIYGARQVGKTTLIKEIQKEYSQNSLYLNCDEPDIRDSLTNKTSTELISFLGRKKLVIIDEAQRVKNIGLTLKLIVDNAPDLQILATGSSSFELSNEISEPLTGRAYELFLYPFSLKEIASLYQNIEIKRLLERQMVLGLYPEVFLKEEQEAEEIVRAIAKNYLYKDILEYQNIKNPDLIRKLLQALALQIGSEVSYSELGNLLGIDRKTVASYIRILEQGFIIFTLPPFSKNIRKELSKLRKIYFYDNGIRNALINNFNQLSLRNDVGLLWENFIISERVKQSSNLILNKNFYFWRTWDQQEVDLVEEKGEKLDGFEIKWQKKESFPPKKWRTNYREASFNLINKQNYLDFLI